MKSPITLDHSLQPEQRLELYQAMFRLSLPELHNLIFIAATLVANYTEPGCWHDTFLITFLDRPGKLICHWAEQPKPA